MADAPSAARVAAAAGAPAVAATARKRRLEVLIVALAVLLLAVAGLLFVIVGLALIAGSLAVPALIVAGGIAGGTGVMLIVIAILVVALFPPLRLFFDGLLALLRISPDLGQVMRSLAAAL